MERHLLDDLRKSVEDGTPYCCVGTARSCFRSRVEPCTVTGTALEACPLLHRGSDWLRRPPRWTSGTCWQWMVLVEGHEMEGSSRSRPFE